MHTLVFLNLWNQTSICSLNLIPLEFIKQKNGTEWRKLTVHTEKCPWLDQQDGIEITRKLYELNMLGIRCPSLRNLYEKTKGKANSSLYCIQTETEQPTKSKSQVGRSNCNSKMQNTMSLHNYQIMHPWCIYSSTVRTVNEPNTESERTKHMTSGTTQQKFFQWRIYYRKEFSKHSLN